MRKRILSMLLAIVMAIGLLPGFSITASAADTVSYVDATGKDMGSVSATQITSSSTTWNTGWYYVTESVTISSRITVSGKVNLILCDGAKLTASKGIGVSSGQTLIVWAQSGGTGILNATAFEGSAAIGGTFNKNDQNTRDAGTITINGGNITATGIDDMGQNDPAAIGGSGDRQQNNLTGGGAGTITINGGVVTATGKANGAGIGACQDIWKGSVTITGGVITTNTLGCSSSSSAGVTSVNITGCPIITCTGARNTNTSWGANWSSGILFTDNGQWATGTVFGNPTLNQDVAIGTLGHEKNVKIPSGSTLTVPSGFTFSTGGGGTVTNEGTIVVQEGGTFTAANLQNTATIQNSGTLLMTATWAGDDGESGDISKNTGTIINGENGVIRSKLKLTGTGSITTNGIKFNLPGLTATPDTRILTHNDTAYTVTLSVTNGIDYSLPKSVTVTVGGETLAASNYTYDSTTGKLTIPAAQIKGNIGITIPYDLWVGGVQLTSDNLTIDSEDIEGVTGSATYEPITNTLTLNSFTYTGAGYTLENDGSIMMASAIYHKGTSKLKLVLKGESSVTQSDVNAMMTSGLGTLGALEVSGSGTLTLSGGSYGSVSIDDIIELFISGGVICSSFELNSGKLVIYGGTAHGNVVRIAGLIVSSSDGPQTGKVDINGGSLEAYGGEATGVSSASSCGVLAESIAVKGGNMTAIGGSVNGTTTDFLSSGVSYVGSFTAYGGVTVAQGETQAFENGTGSSTSTASAPTVDSTFTNAKVWYGESESAANAAGAQVVSELAENYTKKYVKIAAATTYTVTYTDGVDNATVFPDQSSPALDGDATPAFNGNPSRAGYTFVGWTPAVSETVTGDVTYTATWRLNVIVIPTYDVEIAGDITGGEVSASKKLAYKGDTITITAAPDAGYELIALTVTDSRGNAVEVTGASDSKYTFKMPGYDVEIDATFAKIDTSCPGDSTCPMYPYTDLDASLWYHDGIHYCIEHGLMQGIGNNQFDPNGTTTRAMIVTILWRLEGSPAVDYAMSFEDVESGKWYTEAVRWAQANGIVSGYSDKVFGPNDIITREQLATILYRYEQYKGGGFTGAWMIRMDYVDLADVSDWAYEAMCWMNMNGIVNGKPDKVLDPKGSATRAEAAAMLQRYCELSDKDN